MIENLRIISAKQCQTWINGQARVAIKGTLEESSSLVEEPDTIPLVYFEIRHLYSSSFTRIIIIDDHPYAATGMAEIFGDDILILTKSEDLQAHAREAIEWLRLGL